MNKVETPPPVEPVDPDHVGRLDHLRRLDDRFDRLAGHLNALHGELVDLAIGLETDTSWKGPGLYTPEQFLAWRTGLSPRRAREIVTIARRAGELPVCTDALRRGELAVDQMSAIAARAPWWIDREIFNLGRMLNVTQLRRLLNTYPFPADPRPDADTDDSSTDTSSDTSTDDSSDGSPAGGSDNSGGSGSDGQSDCDSAFDDTVGDGPINVGLPGGGSIEVPAPSSTERSPDGSTPNRPPGTDRVWYGLGDDGRWRLHLECDELTGRIIERALDEARDACFRAGNTQANGIDALREMAERSLDAVPTPQRRDRFRVHVNIDTDAIATDACGWRLPDAIRQYLTCDGLLTPTFVADGIPISVGRTQRVIPERTRRVVIHRDQGCGVPGCTATHHLDVHHIIHWEYDGPTDTWNLIALCRRHHRMHHKGELGISGNADQPGGVIFTLHNGRRLASSGARPEPPEGPPPPPAGIYRHPLGERLQMDAVAFRPPPTDPTTFPQAS